MAIVACGHEIYSLYQDKELPIPRELNLSNPFNNIYDMAVSLNNKHIAIYTDTGTLWLGSLDLQKRYKNQLIYRIFNCYILKYLFISKFVFVQNYKLDDTFLISLY